MIKIGIFNKNGINKALKTGIAFGLATITLGSVSGCVDKGSLLSGTKLEDAIVATVDGEKQVLRLISIGDNGDKGDNHYLNIETGEIITDSAECPGHWNMGNFVNPRYTEVKDVRSISVYLTEEDLKKIVSEKFSDSDIIEIIARIKKHL